MAGLGPKWPPSVDLDRARTADLGSAVGLDRARTAVLGGIVALDRARTADLGQNPMFSHVNWACPRSVRIGPQPEIRSGRMQKLLKKLSKD